MRYKMLGIQQIVSYIRSSFGFETKDELPSELGNSQKSSAELLQSQKIPAKQTSSSFGKALCFLLPLASAQTLNGTDTGAQIGDPINESLFGIVAPIVGVTVTLAIIGFSIRSCYRSGDLNIQPANIPAQQPGEHVEVKVEAEAEVLPPELLVNDNKFQQLYRSCEIYLEKVGHEGELKQFEKKFKLLQTEIDTFEQNYKCNISHTIMVNPCVINSGKAYELSRIEKSADRYGLICPVNRTPFDRSELIIKEPMKAKIVSELEQLAEKLSDLTTQVDSLSQVPDHQAESVEGVWQAPSSKPC